MSRGWALQSPRTVAFPRAKVQMGKGEEVGQDVAADLRSGWNGLIPSGHAGLARGGASIWSDTCVRGANDRAAVPSKSLPAVGSRGNLGAHPRAPSWMEAGDSFLAAASSQLSGHRGSPSLKAEGGRPPPQTTRPQCVSGRERWTQRMRVACSAASGTHPASICV